MKEFEPKPKDEQQRVWVAITGRSQSLVLAGLRGPEVNSPGQWGLFGGRVDEGETFLEAAQRELNEEIGVKIDVQHLKLLRQEIIKSRICRWYTIPRKHVNFADLRFTHEVCDFEFGDKSWHGREDLHYSLRNYLAYKAEETTQFDKETDKWLASS